MSALLLLFITVNHSSPNDKRVITSVSETLANVYSIVTDCHSKEFDQQKCNGDTRNMQHNAPCGWAAKREREISAFEFASYGIRS